MIPFRFKNAWQWLCRRRCCKAFRHDMESGFVVFGVRAPYLLGGRERTSSIDLPVLSRPLIPYGLKEPRKSWPNFFSGVWMKSQISSMVMADCIVIAGLEIEMKSTINLCGAKNALAFKSLLWRVQCVGTKSMRIKIYDSGNTSF